MTTRPSLPRILAARALLARPPCQFPGPQSWGAGRSSGDLAGAGARSRPRQARPLASLSREDIVVTPIEAKIVARLRRSRGRYVSRAALAGPSMAIRERWRRFRALSPACAGRASTRGEARERLGCGRLKSEGSYFKLPAPIVVGRHASRRHWRKCSGRFSPLACVTSPGAMPSAISPGEPLLSSPARGRTSGR